MSKFNVGNKVKVIKGSLEGIEGFITRVGDVRNYGCGIVEHVYFIRKDDGRTTEHREGILEKVDTPLSLFEESLNQFISGQDNEAFFEMAGRIPRDKSGRCKLVLPLEVLKKHCTSVSSYLLGRMRSILDR